MPAEAGIQNYLKTLDSGLHGNDVKGHFNAIYKSIKKDITPPIFNIKFSFVPGLSYYFGSFPIFSRSEATSERPSESSVSRVGTPLSISHAIAA